MILKPGYLVFLAGTFWVPTGYYSIPHKYGKARRVTARPLIIIMNYVIIVYDRSKLSDNNTTLTSNKIQ